MPADCDLAEPVPIECLKLLLSSLILNSNPTEAKRHLLQKAAANTISTQRFRFPRLSWSIEIRD